MPIIRAKNHIEEYRARARSKDINAMSGRPDREHTRRVAKRVLGLLPVTSETVLIDVGCGDGTLVSLAKAKRAIGVSPTEEEVERLRAAHPANEFVCATAQSLPFENKFADVLICNGVIITFEDEAEVRKALREFARVTRGQVFLGEVPSEPVPINYSNRSLHSWLLSLWRKHGLVSVAAGTKNIVKAAFTKEVHITYPDRWFYCEPDKFASMAKECDLQIFRSEPSQGVSGRFDYWLAP